MAKRNTTFAPGGNVNAGIPAGQEQPRDRWLAARKALSPSRQGSGRGRRYSVEQVAAALRQHHGCVLDAALSLGVTRNAIYDRISKTAELQKLQVELLEEDKDLHEAALRHLALSELNVTANLAFLNAKARDRGWSGRGDINAQSTNLPPGETHYHLHLHGSSGSRLANLSNDELIARIAQRRAELAAPDPDRDQPREPAGLVEIIPPDRPARQAQPQSQPEPDAD